MKITHYLYNTFVIEWDDKKIAIDPGALFCYYFRFTTLIPKSEWEGITHVFVTHGDPDHYWHVDRVMEASGAPMVCNKTMLQTQNGTAYFLGPRSKGLAFNLPVTDYHTLSVDETIEVDGIQVTGIKITHGPLRLKVGPWVKIEVPGPTQRIGWGSIGFQMNYAGKSIVNLGDTLLHAKEWKKIQHVDVLMLPIGGKTAGNTMDETEALEAVSIIAPQLVIPVHYDCPGLFSRRANPADAGWFKKEVESMGIQCMIMSKGQSIVY